MSKNALKTYRSKRDFSRTSEPSSSHSSSKAKRNGGHSFVIQEHHARRLHYDFRLEMDGVLRSWAVPKGPSNNPSEKRLAIHVEDHPLAYGSFEGTIPKGEYGAGDVKIWDKGIWIPEGDEVAGYKDGHLKFRLQGDRLQGRWALIKIKRSRHGKDNEWLLMKEKSDQTIVQPKKSNVPKRNVRLPRLKPQLATLVKAIPNGHEWLHEIKYDGYRLLAIKQEGRVKLETRSQQDWTKKFSNIQSALESLLTGHTGTVLDGEVVCLDKHGISRFQNLQNALKATNSDNLIYVVFDLIFLDQSDLRQVPLIKRKDLLQDLLKKSGLAKDSPLMFCEHITGQGEAVYRTFCKAGLEGVISKQVDSPYVGTRSMSWVKTKCSKRQEFVIGGYVDSSTNRAAFGSLLLGVYKGRTLHYAGRVGTGFNYASKNDLGAKLQALAKQTPPFADIPRKERASSVHWVKPKLVCEIEFTEWTADGMLRHPSFKGLREDKKAEDVILETAIDDVKTNVKASLLDKVRDESMTRNLTITHPDKILYPDDGYTKHDLADYYDSIASHIIPHISRRALSLVRCPQGQKNKCFFQKHFTSPSKGLEQVLIAHKNGSSHAYPVVNDLPGVMALTQLNVLEIHPWGSCVDQLEKPDRIVFDLDPGTGVTMGTLTNAALLLRQQLLDIGLRSFVKTTGGKGLHVVIPIQPDKDWAYVKTFSKTIAEFMAGTWPQTFVAKMTKSIRGEKIFVDYLRNSRGQTSIATFSTRARSGAPVSMPLAWDDLTAQLDPSRFTIKTVPNIVNAPGYDNPWASFFSVKQKIKDF